MSNKNLKNSVKYSQDYQKCVDKIIKRERFVSYTISSNKIALDGGSFLGRLHEVDVTGKLEDAEKDIHIFIKQILPATKLEFMSIEECYVKECYAYKELFPIYNKIQDSANVPANERFKSAKSFEETNNTTIILDNLSRQGYKVPQRMSVMPLALAELTIKQMARLHGLSIALEKKDPEYFNAKIKPLKTIFDIYDPEAFYKFVENTFNISKRYLNEESKERLHSTLFQSYKEDIQKDFKPTKFLNCLCHGDYKITNLMYREIDGEITDVIGVDYQMIYYGNPFNDFLYLIALGTDRDFRIKHLKHLKNLYYETMKSFLIYFNLDLNLVFPKAEFESQFKDSLRYYLLWAILGLPFMLAIEDDIPDFETDNISTVKDIKADIQITRLQEVVDECIEWGVI